MRKLESLDKPALALVTIGALNYGLIALFQLNLLGLIFGGESSILCRLMYALIGLAGLFCSGFLFNKEN